MKKYQVIKIESNYIGVFDFDNLETATELFNIFVEDAKREEELIITQALYITKNGIIVVSWEK